MVGNRNWIPFPLMGLVSSRGGGVLLEILGRGVPPGSPNHDPISN